MFAPCEFCCILRARLSFWAVWRLLKTRHIRQVHPPGDSLSHAVSPPAIIHKVGPSYTEEAKQAKVQGVVLVSVVVDAEGVPRDLKVVKPLGSGLDQKAIEAVEQWRFRPGTKDGQPVPVKVTIELNFRLLDDPEPSGPPQNAEEAYRRAVSLFQPERIDEKIALLDDAIRMNPNWATPWAARALAKFSKKQYQAAIEDYTAAIQLSPSRIYYRGRAAAKQAAGDTAGADEDLRLAQQLPPSRIRVGGKVEEANLIKKVDPVYPPLARQARIQGTVRFELTIGEDGAVTDLKLLSGHPLLVTAAQEAVKQWVYKPILVNGQPVEVQTTMDVNFTLPPDGQKEN